VSALPTSSPLVPFEKAAIAQSDGGKRVKQRDYLADGRIPVIDQGQSPVGGYTNDEDFAFRGELPVILFGDHTRSVKLVDHRFAVGADGIKIFRPAEGVRAKYLYHWMKSAPLPDRGYGRHYQYLRQLSLPLPPPKQQDEIVGELEKQFSRLDEAVANLKRVKAKLKRQTAAIVSAAIGGELLDRAVFQANTDRPEFAPAIDLPSGWSWASAAEVCEIVASGSTPKAHEMTSGAGEVPFIKVYNLGFEGSLDFTVKPTFIRRAIHEGPLARSRCLPGDVLMNIVGPPLGKVSLVPDAFPEWNINQAIVTFRAGSRILNRLLAYWLMAPPVQRRIERTSKATAGQYNVQVSTCRKLVLPLPPTR
jgi:type I restriction enzyme S subunit